MPRRVHSVYTHMNTYPVQKGKNVMPDLLSKMKSIVVSQLLRYFSVLAALLTISGWLGYNRILDDAVKKAQAGLPEKVKQKIITEAVNDPQVRIQLDTLTKGMLKDADARCVIKDKSYVLMHDTGMGQGHSLINGVVPPPDIPLSGGHTLELTFWNNTRDRWRVVDKC